MQQKAERPKRTTYTPAMLDRMDRLMEAHEKGNLHQMWDEIFKGSENEPKPEEWKGRWKDDRA